MADSELPGLPDSRTIEERMAAKFEPPADVPEKSETAPTEPEPEESEPVQTADDFVEVELDGETYRVPPKLKDAVVSKADYTRRTQEVADQRRTVELQQEAFRVAQFEQEFQRSVAEPLQNLAVLEARTNDLLQNWTSLTADQKQELLYLDKQKEIIQREVQGKRQEFAQATEKAVRELQAKSLEAVRKMIPNWSEETKKDLSDWALSEGYSQHELSSIHDPRHVKTLWKARQYDKLQASKDRAVREVKAAPAVVKPGPSNPMPQKTRDDLALRKQQKAAKTDSDRARVIEKRLEGFFSR